jgi:hypothetical protein
MDVRTAKNRNSVSLSLFHFCGKYRIFLAQLRIAEVVFGGLIDSFVADKTQPT